MTKEELIVWSQLLSAYAEGKTIQLKANGEWEDIEFHEYIKCLEDIRLFFRVKPIVEKRRMTNQELADWLRDCPQEYREYAHIGGYTVSSNYSYDVYQAQDECDKRIIIRRNHGAWEDATIEMSN